MTADDAEIDAITESNRAVEFIHAYRRTDQVDLLRTAVGMFRAVAEASPADDPNRAAFLVNLANGLRELAVRTQGARLLQEAVLLGREAVAATSAGTEQRTMCLSCLGLVLCSLFTETGEASFLREAVQVSQDMADVTSAGAPEWDRFLLTLADALRAMFFTTGDVNWLAQSAATSRIAVSSAPAGHSAGTPVAFMVGVLVTLAEQTGESAPLQEAILAGRNALSVLPPEHPSRPSLLSHYGGAMRVMAERTNDLALLEAAVTAGRQAVAQAKHDDPDLPGYLSNLAGSLLLLAKGTSNAPLLQEALANSQAAFAITPAAHPRLGGIMSTLSTILHELFEQTASLSFLEDAVTLSRDALSSLPWVSDHRAQFLRIHEANLLKLAEQTRDAALLTEAVAAMREAVTLTSPGQFEYADYLWELMVDCRLVFEFTGAGDALREAVDAGRKLAGIVPARDERATLSLLRDNLVALAQLTNEPADMLAAVGASRQVVRRGTSEDGSAGDLAVLIGTLRRLFERTSDRGSLEEAIAAARDALSLTPIDGSALSNLEIGLHALYEQTMEVALLEEAVELGRQAVAVTPAGHDELRRYQSNLGTSLRLMYERTGNTAILHEAVGVSRQAAEAVGNDDPRRPDLLANLTHLLVRLSDEVNDEAIVKEAVACGRDAVAATPAAHPRRSRYLDTLAGAYVTSFYQTGNLTALANAVETGREAVRVALVGNVGRAGFLLNNGRRLWLLHTVTADKSPAAEAVDCFEGVADDETAPIAHRITAYRQLADIASQPEGDPQDALRAIEAAVALLRMSLAQVSRTDRQDAIGQAAGLPSQAAAIAMSADAPRRAVELLEQARGILAADTLDARGPRGSAFVPQAAQAESGPIVYINASETRCDALILTSDPVAPVRVVRLPQLTRRDAFNKVSRIIAARRIAVSPATTHSVRVKAQADIHAILRWIWDSIVEPVLSALGFDAPPPPGMEPRLWWCPVGILSYLPLHAAGYHTAEDRAAEPGRTALDRVISSYTTTLRALTVSRSKCEEAARETADGRPPMSTVIVSEPGGGTLPYLPGVQSEARMLAELIPHSRTLRSPLKEEVIDALPRYDVAHFACHSMARDGRPGLSCLILRDYQANTLTIENIAALNLDQARLAYLSACETAVGDPRLADEAIHLAGAFQLAGYWSVIATFWPIDDSISTDIAHSFYSNLTNQGQNSPDPAITASSLHMAVRLARDRYVNIPSAWAAHFHTGL